MNYKLRCITCKKEFNHESMIYTCPVCGEQKGTLEIVLDYSSVKVSRTDFEKNANMWQFEKVLPVQSNSYRTPLYVGGTPLYKFDNTCKVASLMIKYDGSNPSSSYKDRATALAITKAREYGNDTIYCASTGNAASSLATLSPVAGLKTYIFLPATAPKAKIAQLFVSGAKVIAISDTYDTAFDLSMKIGFLKGWFCRNSAINPYLLEGKKTGALEICVQSEWNLPDYVFVAVGDGTVVSSFYKGFYDFYKLGLIDKIPKIVGVQAHGSNILKQVFDRGEPYCLESAAPSDTIADSISVGYPRDLIKACKYVSQSKGFFVDVEDDAIVSAIAELARKFGVFGEPAGATAYAGFQKAVATGLISNDARVAVIVTGNGLKDINAVQSFVNYTEVKPNITDVSEYIKKLS